MARSMIEEIGNDIENGVAMGMYGYGVLMITENGQRLSITSEEYRTGLGD